MCDKNHPRFVSTDFSEHPIVRYNKKFKKDPLKRGEIELINCNVLDVYGRNFPLK